MDAIAKPPRSSHPIPTIEELRRDGFVLYRLSAWQLVYMLPDRSTWWCRRLTRGQPTQWEVINRDDMDD